MSKYLYATVYEKFTGVKPPEPKNNKPRRRRGCGHPYRMRLNMQDDHHHGDDVPEYDSLHFVSESPVEGSCYRGQSDTYSHAGSLFARDDFLVASTDHSGRGARGQPKVTYKHKRRKLTDLPTAPCLDGESTGGS